MKSLVIMLLLICFLPFAAHASELTFGEPVDNSTEIKISTLMASPENYLNKEVTVSGMVVGTCSKRGCWMDLASDAKFEKLRIKVKDGEMVFPVSAKGRNALATGKFTQVKLDLEHTRRYKQHLAKRAGKPFDPASITEGMSIYQIVPVGVKIFE